MTDTLGKRLRTLRKQHNLTMAELATKIYIPVFDDQGKETLDFKQINPSTISNLENDKNKPTSDLIIALAKFFNVSCDWLLTGKEFEPATEEQRIKREFEMKQYNDLLMLYKKLLELKPLVDALEIIEKE
ncbi:DNA-binding transcriptional regulator, XRE-family HTH domain [Paenibacillus sophorae]|uniref:DNA-binding transcriptional regulator, XRE-family HTH domain n=1 Tax=Paenibacillus sophorae TaxID=1333845 RepID=A0A1H8JI25_9BACL|nr:helix-turn-helix transcriptional regulator [Paenibacillus sophorae]QWU13370.1 helix-turn-helix domain-containing protein [Paenibacillus sophorae]SEN80390.1 DNA-binding transcriptional regulator, XRE-family HTH domain [Paenibacillus sophorae]